VGGPATEESRVCGEAEGASAHAHLLLQGHALRKGVQLGEERLAQREHAAVQQRICGLRGQAACKRWRLRSCTTACRSGREEGGPGR
jgi:hypothetical protein